MDACLKMLEVMVITLIYSILHSIRNFCLDGLRGGEFDVVGDR